MNYDYERWCVLSTNHLQNLNVNRFMYVYFSDVKNGLIQLINLNLENFDGGIAAKWATHQETSGFMTIRPLLDQTYALTVNKDKNSVELKPFVEGNIDQEWTFHAY